MCKRIKTIYCIWCLDYLDEDSGLINYKRISPENYKV